MRVGLQARERRRLHRCSEEGFERGDHCLMGCPQVPAYDWALYLKKPDLSSPCAQRCQVLCSDGCPSDAGCKPKGTLTWNTATFGPDSDFSVNAKVTGEDPNCCEEIAAVQYARESNYDPVTGWSGWGLWMIDDGRVTRGSDPSPYAPYYDKPSKIQSNGSSSITVVDAPTQFGLSKAYDFTVVIICSKGPAAGHRYGTYGWNVKLSGLGAGTLLSPFGGPGHVEPKIRRP